MLSPYVPPTPIQLRRKLSERELAEFRASVEKMDRRDLEAYYKVSHNWCRYDDMRVPSPQMVQEFVQVWKRLRALKGSGMSWT
jgi:hypothetical protein